MTVRAVILGILGALLIAGIGYLNDQVWELCYLVGNHLPVGVFGLLFILVLMVNPLLGRLWTAFRPSEIAVIVALSLMTCSIPGSSLMRWFPASLVMPLESSSVPGGGGISDTRTNAVLSYAPPAMFPQFAANDFDRVIGGYKTGLGTQDEPIRVVEIPWQAWVRPLLMWGAIIGLVAAATICLSLIVHRQWSHYERLRYPIADFAQELIRPSEGSRWPAVFRTHAFWLGFLVILAMRVNNGVAMFFPNMVQVPAWFDLSYIISSSEKLSQQVLQIPGMWILQRPPVYPTAFAFAFLLATDVGFSLGIASYVWGAVMWVLMTSGVDIGSSPVMGGIMHWHLFGSAVGVTLMLLFTGRHYYWRVLKRAITLRSQSDVGPAEAWACRVGIASGIMLMVLLTYLGVAWTLAVLIVPMILMLYLVQARLCAEAGVFYFSMTWQPIGALVGLMGLTALGPQALVTLGFLCIILTLDTRETLMPFVVNGLKIAEDARVRPMRVGWMALPVFLAGLAVAVPIVLHANYNAGLPKWDANYLNVTAKYVPEAGERALNSLNTLGELDKAEGLSPLQRLTSIQPDLNFLWAAGAGLVLVLIVSALRLRFARWPIHPVIFLVGGVLPICRFAPCILLGWLVKVIVTKLGGIHFYHRVKPVMIGIIAGDILGALIFMVYGAINFAGTGVHLPGYWVFPR